VSKSHEGAYKKNQVRDALFCLTGNVGDHIRHVTPQQEATMAAKKKKTHKKTTKKSAGKTAKKKGKR
jgi:hypothetical protein